MTFQYYTSYLTFDQVASIDPDFTFISAFIKQDIRNTVQNAPISLFNNKIDHSRECCYRNGIQNCRGSTITDSYFSSSLSFFIVGMYAGYASQNFPDCRSRSRALGFSTFRKLRSEWRVDRADRAFSSSQDLVMRRSS